MLSVFRGQLVPEEDVIAYVKEQVDKLGFITNIHNDVAGEPPKELFNKLWEETFELDKQIIEYIDFVQGSARGRKKSKK